MLERLRHHLAQNNLIWPGQKVLCAYSGGADSTALVTLLHELGHDICTGHLHHSMRPEADEEAQSCAECAASLGIPHLAGKADVPRIAQMMGISIEEAGRNARYEFLSKAARELNADIIATGHTRDDHIETVLLNLVRGTGMTGLSGIPLRRENIVRPLLWATRRETRQYCEDRNLWFHDDPGNLNEDFTRVRMRARVLPELRLMNAEAEANINRTASLLAEEDQYLNGLAARCLENAEVPLNGPLRFLTSQNEAAFRTSLVREWGPVIGRRAIRLVASYFGASLDSAQSFTIWEALTESSRSITSEGSDVTFVIKNELMLVLSNTNEAPFRYPLTIPGDTDGLLFGWTLQAAPCPTRVETVRDGLSVTIDARQIKQPLVLRSFEPGDRMVPLGFDHERKVSDLLGESKLTKGARQRLPIICDMMGPIWIPGVCVSQRVAATTESEHCLSLRFGPTNMPSYETARDS